MESTYIILNTPDFRTILIKMIVEDFPIFHKKQQLLLQEYTFEIKMIVILK